MSDKEKAEMARKLFAQECDFLLAAAAPVQFPDRPLPEIAFIGRSNVGKSSLVNALTGRKNLARASNMPGRTQQVVFFNLADRMMLVDLPGYGHAEAPVTEKDKWTGLVQAYLRHRRQLKCVFLLLDGRHGVKANDLDMMALLDRAAVRYKIVLTKLDKVKKTEHDERIHQVSELIARHPAALTGVIATSAEEGLGIDALREFAVDIAGI
jgi:GTP-binding protein